MKRRTTAFAGCAALLAAGWPGSATAQTNCETIPAGPDRTDCYIGLSRINREKAAIAAGVARQQSDIAILHLREHEDASNEIRAFEHDPEKWVPVFGKDHAPPKGQSGMTIRRKVIPL